MTDNLDSQLNNMQSAGQPADSSSQQPPKQPEMDISKTTIVVLVILTLIISTLSTWAVLNEIQGIRPVTQGTSTAQAKVSFVLEPNGYQEPKKTPSATGMVIFGVNPPE